MKLKRTVLLLTVCLMSTFSFSAQLEKENILNALRQANDYFMTKWSDPGQSIPYPSRKTNYESNLWTRAYYYEGLMELWKIDPQQRYIDYAIEWGDKHEWKLRGARNGKISRNADNLCAGQTYIFLYELNPQKPKHYISTIKQAIDSMIITDKIDDWSWIDAIQMAMPLFAQLGNITGDTAYYKRAYDMYLFTKYKHGDNGLYNPKDHLWWRDKDFDPPYTEPNGEDCYWSRGNGWVTVAMARMLDLLPKNEPHRKEYEIMLVNMCHALKKVQREDGFWNVSLHDPNNYGGKELTGTAMFTYAMTYGINNGLLNAKAFTPVVCKAWNALVKDCLHANGFLGYVQGTGKEPKDGQPVTYDHQPDFDDFGLGAFLMAGAELYKLCDIINDANDRKKEDLELMPRKKNDTFEYSLSKSRDYIETSTSTGTYNDKIEFSGHNISIFDIYKFAWRDITPDFIIPEDLRHIINQIDPGYDFEFSGENNPNSFETLRTDLDSIFKLKAEMVFVDSTVLVLSKIKKTDKIKALDYVGKTTTEVTKNNLQVTLSGIFSAATIMNCVKEIYNSSTVIEPSLETKKYKIESLIIPNGLPLDDFISDLKTKGLYFEKQKKKHLYIKIKY